MKNEDNWQMFLDICIKTKNTSRLQSLFDLFFTIEEKDHLASRMQIIKALLSKELSQREISEKLHVSISQITRGSNALKIIDEGFLRFIENHVRKYTNVH